MLTSDVQPLKADCATNVTFGKDVDSRDVQPSNADIEICSSESNEALLSAEHRLFRIFVGQERKEKKVARVIEKE